MAATDEVTRQARLAAVAEALPEMLVLCDEVGTVLDVNGSLLDALGWSRDEVLGRSVFDYVHAEDVDYLAASLVERLANQGPGLPVEIRVLTSSGEVRLCEVVGKDLRDVPGVGGIVGSIRDVTRRPALADSPIRLRSMVNTASDITMLIGAEGEVLFASHALARVLGMDPDRTVGEDWLRLFHADDAAEAAAILERIRDPAQRRRTWRARLVHVDGTVRTFDLKADDQLDDPVVAGVLVSARDATELEEAETRFDDLFDDAPIGMALLGEAGVVLRANHALGALVRVAGDAAGRSFDELVGPECAGAVRDQVEARKSGGVRLRVEEDLVRPDGSTAWVSVVVSKVRRSSSAAPHVLVQLEDVTARRDRERALREQNEALVLQARFDAVTGLPNRSGFDEVLDVVVDRSHERGTGLAVMFCDLDGFKEINDRTGHAAGDRVLAVVADRLRGIVRGEDLVARHGGDEFVVVCEGLVDGEALLDLAARIIEGVSAPMSLGGATSGVGISVGIARSVDGSASADELVARADQAMYEAKAEAAGVAVLLDVERAAEAP